LDMKMKAKMVIDRDYKVGVVEKNMYGSFVENLGRCIYGGIFEPAHPKADKNGFRLDVLDVIRELNVPIVRYPGGNFVSTYRWEDGIGPVEKRPARLDLAWKSIEPNTFGLNEFVKWSRLAGVEIMMTLNISTRGILDAQNLVEYCNFPGGTYWSDLRRSHGFPEPHNIKTWCLGNEPDGDWQVAQKTPIEYARIARETGKVLKLIDPSYSVTVSGSSLRRLKTFPYWDSVVLEEVYGYVENVSIHAYYGNKSDDTPNFLAKTFEMNDFIRSAVATCDFVKAKLRTNKKLNLSIDEWNVWYHTHDDDRHKDPWKRAPHLLEEDYTFEDAVMVGCMLITLINNADRVKQACISQLVNAISPIMTEDNGSVWRQTTFYPFLHASNYGRGLALLPIIDGPKYDSTEFTDVPYLEAAVVMDEGSGDLTIFAVNRNLEKALPVECRLRGFDAYEVREHIVYESADKRTRNTKEEPLKVIPHSKGNAKVRDDLVAASLPKLSWNVIRLRRKEGKK
jgi:alpha-N-arabinofuranosidase